MVTSYLGSGPYCYANTLCTVVDEGWQPGVVETLTGAPFGFQMVGPLPLFDPPGWDPDTGLDQALTLLGWASDRETFESAEDGWATGRAVCARTGVRRAAWSWVSSSTNPARTVRSEQITSSPCWPRDWTG